MLSEAKLRPDPRRTAWHAAAYRPLPVCATTEASGAEPMHHLVKPPIGSTGRCRPYRPARRHYSTASRLHGAGTHHRLWLHDDRVRSRLHPAPSPAPDPPNRRGGHDQPGDPPDQFREGSTIDTASPQPSAGNAFPAPALGRCRRLDLSGSAPSTREEPSSCKVIRIAAKRPGLTCVA